jgi:hypothetical protein
VNPSSWFVVSAVHDRVAIGILKDTTSQVGRLLELSTTDGSLVGDVTLPYGISSIALLPSGEIYEGSTDFVQDRAFVAKLDATGHEIWRDYVTSAPLRSRILNMKVDATGVLYMVSQVDNGAEVSVFAP